MGVCVRTQLHRGEGRSGAPEGRVRLKNTDVSVSDFSKNVRNISMFKVLPNLLGRVNKDTLGRSGAFPGLSQILCKVQTAIKQEQF